MIKWTYEACYEEAKKYTSRSEFKKENPVAYRNSLKNNWIDEYTWFTRPNNKWTYETCMEESRKYTTKDEFSKKSSGAYHVARKNKWLDKYTWIPSDARKGRLEKWGKWTYNACYEEAKKYKTRSEFANNNGGAYNSARKHGWLDEYTWLKDERFDLFKDKIDCIYVYEFIDQKSAYIGRTLIKRVKDRDREHIFKEDVVSRFAKENNVAVPEMKILETDLTLSEGSENEGIWIELYKEDGWNILNIAKAGSIGMIGKGKTKYTYEICLDLSLDCNDRAEFRNNHPQAYRISLKNGWLDSFDFKDGKVIGADKRRKWDYQTCYEEAKKYTTITDFENGNKGACVAARNNGWLKDYTWFTLLWQEKWNKETCYKEAKKYTTLDDFMSKSNSCYSTACKNKWIDDYTWLERKRTRRGFWQNYDNCLEEAKKYKTSGDFQRSAPGAYKVSCKHGWLDEFFPKKINKNFNSMKEIRTTQELNEILGSGKSAFIKIGAPWCGPCSQIQRTILDIEGGYTGDYDFYEVDADEADDELVSYLGIYNLPTIVIYNKKGEEIFRKSGLLSRLQLTNLLNDCKNK